MNKFILKSQITNPIIQGTEGNYANVSDSPLTSLIVRLWRTGIILGTLLLLVYSMWGAIDWILAQGDKEKLKSARNKIINGVIGLAILVMLFAILSFLEFLFGFDLLNIDWGALGGGANAGGNQIIQNPGGSITVPGGGPTLNQ